MTTDCRCGSAVHVAHKLQTLRVELEAGKAIIQALVEAQDKGRFDELFGASGVLRGIDGLFRQRRPEALERIDSAIAKAREARPPVLAALDSKFPRRRP